MKYILDTDTLIYFLKGHKLICERLLNTPPDKITTTIINQSELLFGAFYSEKQQENINNIESLLQTIHSIHFAMILHIFFQNKKHN